MDICSMNESKLLRLAKQSPAELYVHPNTQKRMRHTAAAAAAADASVAAANAAATAAAAAAKAAYLYMCPFSISLCCNPKHDLLFQQQITLFPLGPHLGPLYPLSPFSVFVFLSL
ncbi:hypothetical protein Emed_006960 [Eimeria media]